MKSKIAALLLVITMCLAGCGQSDTTVNSPINNNNDVTNIMSGETTQPEQNTDINDVEVDLGTIGETTNPSAITFGDNNKEEEIDTDNIFSEILEVIVIDCGQADSILLHSKGYNILVDTGEDKKATDIKNVLDNKGVKKIDLLIGTHPHADHISGMAEIVNNYEIGKIIMSPTGHTSKLYENTLLAISENGYKITKAVPGNEYSFGNLDINIIGPCDEDYGDLNNASVVAVATYGDFDILLTGDAEMKAEKDFVEYLDENIEVLKVGHHGSDTSTSDNLLDIITADVALISCGVGNDYGHPCQVTLDKLNERGIEIFRTDTSGHLIVRTNGSEYTVETEKDNQEFNSGEQKVESNSQVNRDETQTQTSQNTEQREPNIQGESQGDTQVDKSGTIVYISQTGKKYHSNIYCSRLYTSNEINEITLSDAKSKGIEACSKCWE